MEMVVGIRNLKTHLGRYLREVKSGTILVITERGKPIGRLVPITASPSGRLSELMQAGLAAWSGRKLEALTPPVQTQGERTVAELLLEDRE